MDVKVQAATRVPQLSVMFRMEALFAGNSAALCWPRGGKARDSEWCSFRERNTNDPHSLLNLHLSQGAISQMLLYWSFLTYSMRIGVTNR